MAICITKHAKKRIMARVRIPKRAIRRFVMRAVKDGKSIADFDGWTKNYIRDRYRTVNGVTLVSVYQDFVFIWSGDNLITVLNLPDSAKDKIKNIHS